MIRLGKRLHNYLSSCNKDHFCCKTATTANMAFIIVWSNIVPYIGIYALEYPGIWWFVAGLFLLAATTYVIAYDRGRRDQCKMLDKYGVKCTNEAENY